MLYKGQLWALRSKLPLPLNTGVHLRKRISSVLAFQFSNKVDRYLLTCSDFFKQWKPFLPPMKSLKRTRKSESRVAHIEVEAWSLSSKYHFGNLLLTESKKIKRLALLLAIRIILVLLHPCPHKCLMLVSDTMWCLESAQFSSKEGEISMADIII